MIPQLVNMKRWLELIWYLVATIALTNVAVKKWLLSFAILQYFWKSKMSSSLVGEEKVKRLLFCG
jgi:hypothetical protein